MSIDVKKKAKKIATKLIEATIMEISKELLRRLLRRKPPEETGEVQCGVVDRFESFFLKEFEQYFNQGNSQNILTIINMICSNLGSVSEFKKHLDQLRKDYEWVEREFSDTRLFLSDYKKYGDAELFMRATKHMLLSIKEYVKFADPLNELLLIHGKPETVKVALKTIEKHYNPSKEHFNKLIFDYYKFAIRFNEHVYTTRQYETMLMYLPDIPSKENETVLLKLTKEESIVENLKHNQKN